MDHPRRDAGWIEVICGPMFSGKSEELIRRLRRAAIAKQRVQVFKPAIDRRYHDTRITSHSAQSLDAEALPDVASLVAALDPGTQVVGIDEAQFFGPTLVAAVQSMADRGVRVVIAGLDQDYLGRPFEPMPQLLAIAEQITKCLAVCSQCGALASRSFRLSGGGERVQVGAADSYEARCRACYLSAITAPAEEDDDDGMAGVA
ncbi:MAG: thymidine kinase [Deltaproteobacteria bacterium]|nr:thymidine kinase [Deltaproteobacteria bacterium]